MDEREGKSGKGKGGKEEGRKGKGGVGNDEFNIILKKRLECSLTHA